MGNKYIILILFTFSIIPLKSEINFNFNGYASNLISFQSLSQGASDYFSPNADNEIYLADQARVRFRPFISLWEGSRLELHYEIDMLYLNNVSSLFGQAYGLNRQAVNLNWQIYNKDNFTSKHYIDRLYFKQSFDFGEIIFGRQRISWGVGRVWQPTDLFNPISPANFAKLEKDGADALSAKFSLGNFTDFQLVYNFREMWKDGNFGGRFRTNYDEYDFSVLSGYFDKKVKVGGDFAGNFFTAGLRGEGIYSYYPQKPDSSYIRFILGIDYQFTPELYMLMEYQFNGEGASCSCGYQNLLPRLRTGEILNLSRNYFTMQAQYKIHPLVTITLGGLINIKDGSGYGNILFNWSALESLNVSLGGMLFCGSRLSEYWYYPTDLYLIGQWFF